MGPLERRQIMVGRLLCSHWNHRNCTSGLCSTFLMALKALLALPLRSHSCSSLERPPDHTRRGAWSESRRRSSSPNSGYSPLALLVCVFGGWRRSGSRGMTVLTSAWLRDAEDVSFAVDDYWRAGSWVLGGTGGLTTRPSAPTNQ